MTLARRSGFTCLVTNAGGKETLKRRVTGGVGEHETATPSQESKSWRQVVAWRGGVGE